MKKSTKVFGIDLGTTYSAVSYVDAMGRAVLIPNAENSQTTPSVVWFDEDRVVVGEEAKETAKVDPLNVCSFVKRSMGDDSFYAEFGGRRYLPEEISSFILRKLVQDASNALGEEIRDVVITCPAYFFVKERNATRRAGELAGLNVLQIVNEPTAAAVSYGFSGDDLEKTVLVYDLGGGTFDVTAIKFSKGSVDVICTDGDHRLGGKDWDDRLVHMIAERFCEATGCVDDPIESEEAGADLFLEAEKLKKRLSSREKDSARFTWQGDSARIEITRKEFESSTADLLERTVEFAQNVEKLALEKGARIDELVLVGGSSNMPAVARRLREAFRLEPKIYEPHEAVAKGAAIIGNNLALQKILADKIRKRRRSTDLTLDDASDADLYAVAAETGYSLATIKRAKTKVCNVASKSFGVALIWDESQYDAYMERIASNSEEFDLFAPDNGERVSNLIFKNTPLPATKELISCTYYDRQTSLDHCICENLADEVASQHGVPLKESNLLRQSSFSLPKGLPKGAPIRHIFELTVEGLLTATIIEPSQGWKETVKIETGSVQSEVEKRFQEKRCAELIVE